MTLYPSSPDALLRAAATLLAGNRDASYTAACAVADVLDLEARLVAARARQQPPELTADQVIASIERAVGGKFNEPASGVAEVDDGA